MNLAQRTIPNKIILYLSLVFGIIARLIFPYFGYNFDVESYWVVSSLHLLGEGIYENTSRYNYGPVWFVLLGCFRRISSHFVVDSIFAFHIIIVAFLTIVDLIIARILEVIRGYKAAIRYFLNPISILITGFHSQFDNISILLGFVAAMLLDIRARSNIWKYTLITGLLIGVSLSIKHLLFYSLFGLCLVTF